MAASSPFAYSQDELKNIAQDALAHARSLGASDAAVDVSEGGGLTVTVRKGGIETIEQNKDKVVGVTVFVGLRRGHASTSDFKPAAIRQTVEAAYSIARFTAEDDCAGLPAEDEIAFRPPRLDLYFPWAIDAEGATRLALECEHAAFAVDKRVTNSEGATVSAQHSQFVLANTRGFLGGYPYSRHYVSVAPIAGKGDNMQRDDWYSSMRDPADLSPADAVGRYAAERALSKLHARRLSTRKCPVLFEAPLACGLLGAFVQAVSGGSLYRKSSFLLDSLGKRVFAPHVDVTEDPFEPKGMGSCPFDEEGVKVSARQVVAGGVVQGYFLSTYSARKLKMKTTGNGGGSHNLTLSSSLTGPGDDFRAMLRKMDTGLLVTDLMGQGVNYVTGDYSRGAVGFWVEGGEIQYPVHEITIAGNMVEMFKRIVAVGNDRITRGTKETGSILIEEMTVAGQ